MNDTTSTSDLHIVLPVQEPKFREGQVVQLNSTARDGHGPSGTIVGLHPRDGSAAQRYGVIMVAGDNILEVLLPEFAICEVA